MAFGHVATLVAVLIISLPVAGAAREEISIAYAAPEGCPDRGAFLEWVMARTARATIVEGRPRGRAFVVAIVAHEGGFAGVLRVIDGGGDSSIRRIETQTCVDVSRALAFTTALAIDEAAASAGEALADAPSAPATVTAPAAAPRARVEMLAGVHVAAAVGVGPEAMVAIPIFVDVGLRGGWRPRVRLGVEVTSGSADDAVFRRVLARIDACPAELRAGIVAVQPCVAGDAGALWARGEVLMPLAQVRPWVSLGGAARASLRVSARARIELEGRVGFPVVRDRFIVSGVAIHEVPLATFSLGGGIAMSFR